MAASTPEPRRGTMLRRTLSFTDLYNPAPGHSLSSAPVDDAEDSEFLEPDTAPPDENTSAASAESAFSHVRRTVHKKGPYVVKKDKATMRANAKAKVRYDLKVALGRFVLHLTRRRRMHPSRSAAEESAAADLDEDEVLPAEYQAAEAAYLASLAWPSENIVLPAALTEKRKRTDDDDALDEELNSIKRSRYHDDPLPSPACACPPAEDTPELPVTAPDTPLTPSPVPATATDSDPTVASTTTATRPITEDVPSTPATTAPAASPIATPDTSPSATEEAANTALPTETPTPVETPPTRRRRSTGTAARDSPSVSTAATANSNNSRLRRRSSAPVLAIYQGPEPEDEPEPEPESSPSPRKNKKKRRSSLTAKENRGVRRNAANDPVQN